MQNTLKNFFSHSDFFFIFRCAHIYINTKHLHSSSLRPSVFPDITALKLPKRLVLNFIYSLISLRRKLLIRKSLKTKKRVSPNSNFILQKFCNNLASQTCKFETNSAWQDWKIIPILQQYNSNAKVTMLWTWG